MKKRISALVLALGMVLTMGTTTFADGEATLTGGESGNFTQADTVVYDNNKAVKIAKEITAYNVDENTIQAPTISYTYSIATTTGGKSITDDTSDHANGAVTRTTLPGVVNGVTLYGTAENVIAWTASETMGAAKAGDDNIKYLTVDFSKVVFSQPGVYRYLITEDLTEGYSYASSGVTETTDTTGGHSRYLDVYVKASSTYTNGTLASDWDIYGYVCIYDDDDITPDGDTTTTGAVKTNGFVAATNDGTSISADSYYTFNVTVSKTLEGDNYSNSHLFPVNVDFTNSAVTQNVLLLAETSGSGTVEDFSHTAVPASSLDGLAKIAKGGSIKYIGIPCGTTVDVYETNDVAGTTYATTLTVDGTKGETKSISSTDTPNAFASYSVQAYNSLKGTVQTAANTVDNTDGRHTIVIANVFQLISPTGVVLRIAPYALMLAAGIALFVIARKRRTAKKA